MRNLTQRCRAYLHSRGQSHEDGDVAILEAFVRKMIDEAQPPAPTESRLSMYLSQHFPSDYTPVRRKDGPVAVAIELLDRYLNLRIEVKKASGLSALQETAKALRDSLTPKERKILDLLEGKRKG